MFTARRTAARVCWGRGVMHLHGHVCQTTSRAPTHYKPEMPVLQRGGRTATGGGVPSGGDPVGSVGSWALRSPESPRGRRGQLQAMAALASASPRMSMAIVVVVLHCTGGDCGTGDGDAARSVGAWAGRQRRDGAGLQNCQREAEVVGRRTDADPVAFELGMGMIGRRKWGSGVASSSERQWKARAGLGWVDGCQ